MQFSSVVFPDPEGPSKIILSPSLMLRVIPSKALIVSDAST